MRKILAGPFMRKILHFLTLQHCDAEFGPRAEYAPDLMIRTACMVRTIPPCFKKNVDTSFILHVGLRFYFKNKSSMKINIWSRVARSGPYTRSESSNPVRILHPVRIPHRYVAKLIKWRIFHTEDPTNIFLIEIYKGFPYNRYFDCQNK